MTSPVARKTAERQRVTAVVVTYNSEDLIPDCLESLEAALDGGLELEIVVSDNASSDGSIDVCLLYTSPSPRD